MMANRVEIGRIEKGRVRFPAKETGAVLIVGLLLLISMTLLTVGGMQSVAMNENMASNSHLQNRRFQAAESAGEFSLDQTAWINQTLTYMDDPDFSDWPSYTVDINDQDLTIQVTLEASSSMMMGYSLNMDGSSSYIRLQADSQSNFATGASTRLVQGFVRVGAG